MEHGLHLGGAETRQANPKNAKKGLFFLIQPLKARLDSQKALVIFSP